MQRPEFVQWIVQRYGDLPEGPIKENDYNRFKAEYTAFSSPSPRRTDTGGWFIKCECEDSHCSAAFEIETFPKQDTVMLALWDKGLIKESIPVKLTDLKKALET